MSQKLNISNPKLASLPTQPVIKIVNTPIKRVNSTKLLGIFIDQTLSWSDQIDNIAKKVSMGISALKQVRPFVTFDTLIIIYNALILPYFDYRDVVWSNCNKGFSDKLQRLQNRAARVITQSDYDVRSVDILKKLKWDNLEERRFKHKACAMYKVLNNGAPSYLSTDYNIVGDTVKYNLRGDDTKLTLPKAMTDSLKRSFRYEGAKIWNSLPLCVRSSQSFTEFKTKLSNSCK